MDGNAQKHAIAQSETTASLMISLWGWIKSASFAAGTIGALPRFSAAHTAAVPSTNHSTVESSPYYIRGAPFKFAVRANKQSCSALPVYDRLKDGIPPPANVV